MSRSTGLTPSVLQKSVPSSESCATREEESLAELEAKNSKYVHFIVSDTAQAARIMERSFGAKNFTVENDRSLRLYDVNLPVTSLTRAFIENGLEVAEAHTCEDTLEDYFKRVTGGEGIA